MRTLIFLQARMGSTRLPGKVLFKLCGKSVVEVTAERLKRVKGSDGVVLLTGPKELNQALIDEATNIGLPYFSGSEENLLDRFYRASKELKPDVIIRVTADCPLIDPDLISEGLQEFEKGNYDLLLNGRTHSFPHGLDYEIFTADILERHWQMRRAEFANEETFQETFINPTEGMFDLLNIRIKDVAHEPPIRGQRWTLDYSEDYDLISKIYDALYPGNPRFTWQDVLQLMQVHPELGAINAKHLEPARS